MQLCALDVHYHPNETAVSACILFNNWAAPCATRELKTITPNVAPYKPGSFYERELPCLLSALAEIKEPLDAILIDGYVWLSADHKPGLGAHLYESLGNKTPVIGIAKTPFASAAPILLNRGESTRPLYITAAGIDPHAAANHIKSMHGKFRIPTLLKLVDDLSRRPL
jgi:deoxyribonuclease V